MFQVLYLQKITKYKTKVNIPTYFDGEKKCKN